MDTDTKVIVYKTSDPDVREYIVTDEKLSDKPIAAFSHPLHGTEENFPVLGRTGEKLARMVMDPKRDKDIQEIEILQTSLRVRKTNKADWPTVELYIVIEAFKEALGFDPDVRQFSEAEMYTPVHA